MDMKTANIDKIRKDCEESPAKRNFEQPDIKSKEIDHIKSTEIESTQEVTKDINSSDIKSIDDLKNEYIDDLKERSEVAATIPDDIAKNQDWKCPSPEENGKMREEFDSKKAELKEQWAKNNGIEWPKYERDVYSSNGNLIRKAGTDYDAHHIVPLGMGGKNEARNITPLHALDHYDKQGVHAPTSPYSELNTELKKRYEQDIKGEEH